ncbi:MAG: AAA family ATPase [Woeseiaceae bacterium]|nr:AAA family ATPase [Woeseiaceae bacterium]
MAHVTDSDAQPDAVSVVAPALVSGGNLIGRCEALKQLHAAAEKAIDGHGSLVLISGEPGIGKTRVAEEVARHAEDRGLLALWGRCFEQPGAPPYWPWVQLLRECANAHSDDQLRTVLKSGTDVIAALTPEIYGRLGIDPVAVGEAGTADNRHRLFDAIARFFNAAAANVPLVLLLDDLHWADASSLNLLEFFAKGLRSERICVVCLYRDVEVTRQSPLLSTLGELARIPNTVRLRLTGLSHEETTELTAAITGLRLQQDVTRSIYEQTDGNPFFVSEIAKLIADVHVSTTGPVYAIDVPDSVREAIGRRLDTLSTETNDLLAAAAVLGRDFDARVIAHVMSCPLGDCLQVLGNAAAAGIVQAMNDDAPTAWRFNHALMRETLYEEITTLERLQLHRRIADAIVAIHVDGVDTVLSEVVHHMCEASVLGNYETAVEYTLLAAERAERLLAYEEACRHFTKLIDVMTANSLADHPQVAHAYFRIGYLAIPLGRMEDSFDYLMRAVRLARLNKDARLFARVASAMVQLTSDSSQAHTAPLLEEALQMLPQKDIRHRAIVLAHLAFALRAGDRQERVHATGEQAIELARETGKADVLAIALRFAIMGLRGDPSTIDQRLEYGRELVTLADVIDDIGERSECWYWQLLNLLEAGRMDEFDALLEPFLRNAEQYHLLHHSYAANVLSIARSLMQGQWSGLEKRIENVRLRGQKPRPRDAEGVYGAQMFQLNRDLGRLRTMAPLMRKIVAEPESRLWAPGTMLICCEVGMLDEARRRFEELARDGFAAVPRDDMWITCIVFCAETCVMIKDLERAKTLYRLLLPYAEQTAGHAQAVCFGSAAAYLAMLAELIGKPDAARSHYEYAIGKNREMSAWPALARHQVHYAKFLLASESQEDHNSGRQLLIDAEQLAARFDMRGLAADIDALRATGSASLPDDLTAREAEVLKLLAIGRSNKDIAKVLTISLSTVATHVRNILSKTGCANRTEAAAYAMQHDFD